MPELLQRTHRHKVFVSYHHENDEGHRNRFERLFAQAYNIMDSRSVELGDIPNGLETDEIARRIRDKYRRDATVTVVLAGKETWRRKHVDWEIAATVRGTDFNPRSGLLGILLPTHPSYGEGSYAEYITPPRLHYNVECGFAKIYNWNESPTAVAGWIDEAFRRRNEVNPDNSSVRFAKNWNGDRWYPQKPTKAR